MTPTAHTLVYFAPVAWDGYPQRPHYFVQHVLKHGGARVVWIDPYPTRLPSLQDFHKIARGPRITLERPAGLTILSVRTLPFEPLAVGRWLNRELLARFIARKIVPLLEGRVTIGVGRPSGLAAAALARIPHEASFYDAMDNFPEFYRGVSKKSAMVQEREIVANVDLVVTSSSALWAKFEGLGRPRLMIHNAFDMAALPRLTTERNGHSVFGYVGCIGAWFDWATTARLARAFPDSEVHVVGPCFAKPPRNLPANVTMFPACPVERAIEYFQHFSVGLIPFRRTPLTDGVDPVKYYGYRGMGLPVLSTSFGEMARRGVDEGAFLIHQGQDLEQAAAAALRGRIDPAVVEQFRREHTWERRFDEAQLLDRVLV